MIEAESNLKSQRPPVPNWNGRAFFAKVTRRLKNLSNLEFDVNKSTSTTPATVMPTMRYRNAAAAIEWLMKAFGFEKKVAYASENGEIMHAELTFGNGMIMLGSCRDDDLGQFMGVPSELGGRGTGCVYVVVDDVEAHHATAVAAGAKIVRPLTVEPHGATYCCLDLEGHLWSFGDYAPWEPPTAA